jgi:hypothetical protein
MRKIRYTGVAILISVLIITDVSGQKPSIYNIKRMSFSSGLFNDISPVIVKDGVLFCSDRRTSGINDRTSFDGKRLYNIYIAEKKDTTDWRKPKLLRSERSTFFNNGPLCLSPDGKTVYFTSEIETGKVTKQRGFINYSGIYEADLSGSELVSLRPFKHNNQSFNTGQPSISSDGRFLFFASDRPGGSGGSDIYYCERVNGEWGTPVNLGKNVNSPGSENYPYIHPSGKLYFSSNRSSGIGGMDVYYTTIVNGVWEAPVILPEPINSPADDFAFVADINLQTGYFASNRRRNDDIFEFSSTIIRRTSCDTLELNSYCYEFIEENAARYDSMPFRYEWKFGDGNTAFGAVVEHCYGQPGNYIVELDVVNLVTKELIAKEKTINLEVKQIEQPYISSPGRVTAGAAIKMNADSTYLPGWNISRFYWNFGDETIAIGREVDKVYLKPGTYNIQLIVSEEPDAGGVIREGCVCKNITVIHQP